MATAPPIEEQSAPPALFDHCVKTYQAMLREAQAVVTMAPADGTDPQQGQIIVYEGFLTQLVTSKLNLSVPYYTSIRQKLIQMGCVRQLKRGGGTSPSQWELIYEPTLEKFNAAQPKKTPKQTKESMLQEQVNNLSARVSELESTLESILEALAEQFGTSPKEEAS